jgi:NAD(P)H-hydrate repair Nnr-like enzyme with NAD(P)H-hydrate dehydratase domain
MNDYLHQTAEAPLYPKVLWNRPISRGAAGMLAIIGGHAQEFGDAQAAYQFAVAAGAGKVQVILPDSLRKLLHDTWFVPSSPSGSIGRGALGEIDYQLQSADGILIGPNLSQNSETAIVAETIIGTAAVPVTVAADAIDTLAFHARVMTENEKAVLVIDMPQVFRLAGELGIPLYVRPERELLGRIEIIQQLAAEAKAAIIFYGRELIVAHSGKLSVTATPHRAPRDLIAAIAATFWMQRQSDPFERLTTAAFVAASAMKTEGQSVQELVKSIVKTVDEY